MFAPVTFVQKNGMRICLDAWDVCNVVEKEEGTEITYMPTDQVDIFVARAKFDEVIKCLQIARTREPQKYGDGDEWKNGRYDDHED